VVYLYIIIRIVNVSYYRFATFFDINISSSSEYLPQTARGSTHYVSRQVDSKTANNKFFKCYKPELVIWKTPLSYFQLRREYLSALLLSVLRKNSTHYVYDILLMIFPSRKGRVENAILRLCYGLHGPDFEYLQRHFPYFYKFQKVPGSQTIKDKVKAIPVQALTDPEVSRKLRLQDFKTIGT